MAESSEKRAAATGGAGVAGANRNRQVVRASAVGIAANVLLAGFKALVGMLSNSIAIILDAVNNLSDALSSIITIIGTKLANKRPDREHPYGHGRGEYVTTIAISVIIMWAGIAALQEAVERILNPETATYTAITLAVVAVATVVKIFLGRYTQQVGRRTHSGTLVASGKDALLDAVISTSTLVAAGIYLIWGISLEAWLGAAIALVIIKAGIDILREAMSDILGQRVDSELSRAVKRTICTFPEVHGAYDLAISDFGPDQIRGSVNIEVDDCMSAAAIAQLSRRIQQRVAADHGVLLNSVGIYSTNTDNPEADALRKHISQIVWDHAHVLEMHGFYVNRQTRTITFDVVIGYDAADRQAVYRDICEQVRAAYPEWTVEVILDADVSD